MVPHAAVSGIWVPAYAGTTARQEREGHPRLTRRKNIRALASAGAPIPTASDNRSWRGGRSAAAAAARPPRAADAHRRRALARARDRRAQIECNKVAGDPADRRPPA